MAARRLKVWGICAYQSHRDKKPDYDAFAHQTPMLTEKQVVEQFGSGGGESAA